MTTESFAPTAVRAREWQLAARPTGEPAPGHFALVERQVLAPAEGQVLVRNEWMSVDPYMRGRMDDVPSYIAPFEVGAALEGAAVGTVIASRADAIPVGATVSHFAGWRTHALIDAAAATVVETGLAPASAYLGPLGTTGLTAWLAVTETAPVREGDVVWVSSAAGAVGSVAGQIARKLGAATVIGSAGGPEKAEQLTAAFGFDHALDHRAGDLAGQLAEAAPDGIDVYVDHVGGDHLRAAIGAMRPHGRIALVGAIAEYNASEPSPGPSNLYVAVRRELSIKGLLVTNWLHLLPRWVEQGAAWLADGSLRTEETVFHGLDHAPEALLATLRGGNVGKTLVALGED